MKKGIIGKKLGMTQIFDENGNVIPVTVIEAGPCTVVQKKTVENDGYSAVQLGFSDIAERKLNKPTKGHFAKAGVTLKKHLKEFRLDDAETMNVGDEIKADAFAAGDNVDILSRVDGNIVAVEYKNQIGLSFHPEMSDDTRLHEYFIKKIREK